LSAIHDAVCLANWINVLPSLSVQDIEANFKEYYDERYPQVMASYRTTLIFAKSMNNNVTGVIIRFINSHMPKWLWRLIMKKAVVFRPQASFLDHVKDTGTVRPIEQPSLIKTKILIEALLKKEQLQKALAPLTSSATTGDPVAI